MYMWVVSTQFTLSTHTQWHLTHAHQCTRARLHMASRWQYSGENTRASTLPVNSNHTCLIEWQCAPYEFHCYIRISVLTSRRFVFFFLHINHYIVIRIQLRGKEILPIFLFSSLVRNRNAFNDLRSRRDRSNEICTYGKRKKNTVFSVNLFIRQNDEKKRGKKERLTEVTWDSLYDRSQYSKRITTIQW